MYIVACPIGYALTGKYVQSEYNLDSIPLDSIRTKRDATGSSQDYTGHC